MCKWWIFIYLSCHTTQDLNTFTLKNLDDSLGVLTIKSFQLCYRFKFFNNVRKQSFGELSLKTVPKQLAYCYKMY